MSYEAQRGMYVHPTYAVTPAREPLGVIDAWMWARAFKQGEAPREGVSESLRWLEGYACGCAVKRHQELTPDAG